MSRRKLRSCRSNEVCQNCSSRFGAGRIVGGDMGRARLLRKKLAVHAKGAFAVVQGNEHPEDLLALIESTLRKRKGRNLSCRCLRISE